MGKGKVWKYVFQVVVPDWDQFDEKEFKLSWSHGNELHKILQKGYTLIRVKRIGSHTETRYEFTPYLSTNVVVLLDLASNGRMSVLSLLCATR